MQTPRATSAPTKALHFRQLLLPEGWAKDVRLEVAHGAFVHIAPGVPPRPRDERAALGIPGLGNLHSHGFQRALSGLSETRSAGRDDFWSWRERMYALLARMTPDDVEAITAQAFVEMLESGFTRVAEFHYLHHGVGGVAYTDSAEMCARVVQAAETVGIGLTLLPVFYAHSDFGGAAPLPTQTRFVLDLDGYADLLTACRALLAPLAHARLGVAPHSLRAVTPNELAALVPLANAGPIHIHVAEQQREVEQCLAWSGSRPVQWLLDHAPVDRRWCLVHATHITDAESERLARTEAVVGLCPLTEANLGDGLFPLRSLLQANGRLGIGSDSNISISAAEELRLLEYGQRLARRERNVVAELERSSGRALFDHACLGGAQALGHEAGIRLGAPADLVALRPEHASLLERQGDALLDSWIFGRSHDAIDRVWSAGVELVSEGRHRAREAVAARYRSALARLLAG